MMCTGRLSPVLSINWRDARNMGIHRVSVCRTVLGSYRVVVARQGTRPILGVGRHSSICSRLSNSFSFDRSLAVPQANDGGANG